MKQSIIFKTLFLLGSSTTIVFGLVYIFFFENNRTLISDIETHNTDYLIETLSLREKNSLKVDAKRVQKDIHMIARHASEHLQNFDKEGLKDILKHDMLGSGIMLIMIWDNDLNDVFLISVVENGKVVFKNDIPEKFEKFEKFKVPINDMSIDKKNIIGEAIVYYDNSHILNEIALLKEKSKKDMLRFNDEIDVRLYDFMKYDFIISIIGLLIVLIIMFVLFKKLVSDPLKKLKLGLDDFFLFIQNKKSVISKIDISSKDEFGEMAHSLNENIEVSAKFLEDIYQLNIALSVKTKKEKVLLDNAMQGFLTFDESLIIDDEYSIKCEKMLGFNIANKDILSVLFLEDYEKINKSKKILLYSLSIDNEIAQKSILSLLPNNIFLNKMHLKLEYRIVEDMKFMLIITNETEQRELEARIQKEQNILKMIIAIIKDSDIFHDLKKDFEYFIENKAIYGNSKKNTLDNLNNIYRIIHTFKGLFLQLFMYDTARQLHEVESQLAYLFTHISKITNEDISDFLNTINFNAFMSNDCNDISRLLGEAFVNNNNSILVDSNIIKDIKNKYISLMDSSRIENKLSKEILDNIIELMQKPLIYQLESYPKHAMQLAQKLGKEIYEFEVIGSKDIIITEDFKPFIKSLVHIFRNAVDHGIETAEERMELDKDSIGTITCSFDLVKSNLEIIISDDGSGINIEKIETKLPKEVDILKLSDNDIYLYIFQEHISTKDKITDTSGRGIGMSSVKSEIEKLGGTIKIQSETNIGTTFIFNVPFTKKGDKC